MISADFFTVFFTSFGSWKEILLFICYFLGALFIVSKIPFFNILKKNSWIVPAVFTIKVITGIALWWYYMNSTSRLNADIFKYFDESYYIYNAFWNHPWDFVRMIFEIGEQKDLHIKYYDYTHNWYKPIPTLLPNDNRTMIKLNAIFRIASLGNYHIHSLFFNFLSFTGTILVFKSFKKFFYSERLLLFSLSLIPSFLFWSSGALKESLLVFNLGVFIYCVFNLKENSNWKYIIVGVLSLLFFIYIKLYILIALIPASVCYLYSNSISKKTNLYIYSVINLVAFGSSVLLGTFFNNLSLLHLIEKKQEQFIKFSTAINAGSRFELTDLSPTLWSFINNLPEVLVNTIIRPFIWETHSVLTLISSVENTGVLGLVAICFFSFKKKNLNYNFFFFLINLWLVTYIIIGYTTPVWGAISRYKIAVLPFFLLSYVYLADRKKKDSL